MDERATMHMWWVSFSLERKNWAYLVSEQSQSVENYAEQNVDGGEGLSKKPAVAR